MLHRKIYQFYSEGYEVWIYLRDQHRWLERVRITDIEGEVITLRYETEEEEEICSWEEIVRLDSIGAVMRKLSVVPTVNVEPMVSEECHEAERISDSQPETNAD